MNKILFPILSVLILIIGALLIVPSFIDWSQYKDQIKTQVEKATGYQLDINGELRAAFLPTPHVNINNISIDSGTAEGAFAFQGQVEKASVSVALLPLLSGNIQVSDVTMIAPQINLSEQKNTKVAQLDKVIEGGEGKSANNKSAPAVSIDKFYTENAKITYKPTNGEAMVFQFPKLELKADSLFGPYTVNGRIQYQDFDLEFDGKVGEYDKAKPMSVAMTIDGGAYQLSYNGIADMTKTDPEIQGEFKINTNSLAKLAAQFGTKDLPIKDQSMVLSGLLAGTAKAITLNNGSLTLGNSTTPMPIKFNYGVEAKSGNFKIQNIPGGGMVDMDIAMGGDAPKFGGQIHIENIKALTVDTLGVIEAKTFDNPQIPNSAKGDIKVSMGDTMTLNSNDLTLGQYNLKTTSVAYQAGEPAKINLSIGNFEGASIKASGAMDTTQGINVNISHPNAAKFISVFQKDYQSSHAMEKPFSFIGKIFVDGDTIRVDGMDAKIGSINSTGNLVVNNGGAIPSIQANLVFGNLDTQALISGKKSEAATTGGGASTGGTAQQTSGAPWTRDAIDTSALRSINLDLNAKAQQLVHGTWLISNPEIDIDLNGGVLAINTIKGGLFGGAVDLSGRVEAKAEGQPLNITSKINATDVDLAKLVRAAMSQNKDRVTGMGSFNLNLSTNGLSSSALVNALNGDGKITTGDLILNGIDLAKITEAISDESLTDLAAVVQGAFKTGQTPFEPIDYTLAIREGTMPINNFTLVSPTAKLISNGEVSFARWNMDVKNTVDFTNPDDLPNVDMTIKGPLNAPQQNVATDVLRSFIMNKYGAKIQNKVNDLLGDKLKDTPAADIINNLLGLPQQPQQATPEPTNDNTTPATEEPEATAPQPTPQQQLIKGLFDQIGK